MGDMYIFQYVSNQTLLIRACVLSMPTVTVLVVQSMCSAVNTYTHCTQWDMNHIAVV